MILKKLTIIVCFLLLLTTVFTGSIYAGIAEDGIDVTTTVLYPPIIVRPPIDADGIFLAFGNVTPGEYKEAYARIRVSAQTFIPFHITLDGGMFLGVNGQRNMKRIVSGGTDPITDPTVYGNELLAYSITHNGDTDKWEPNVPHEGFEGAGYDIPSAVRVDVYGHIGTAGPPPPPGFGSTPDWANIAVGDYEDIVNFTVAY